MTTLLIPTPHELGQLPDLAAALRPMEPQPHFCRMPGDTEPDWVWFPEGPENTGTYPPVPMDRIPRPFATGDVIAWGEKWCRTGEMDEEYCSRVTNGRKVRFFEPASTMPVELARYKSTVAECRPVEVSKLTAEDVERLGYRPHAGIDPVKEISKPLIFTAENMLHRDWNRNNPKHPFATSWAWWIGLKGTQ